MHTHSQTHTSVLCLCNHVTLNIKLTWLFNIEEGCLIDVGMESPLSCCVFMWNMCFWLCAWERERETGSERSVGEAAVAWGEVLPWFSQEFLCFWSQNGGNWICIASGALQLEKSPAHLILTPSLMAVRGSSVFKARRCKGAFKLPDKREGDLHLHTRRSRCYSNINVLQVKCWFFQSRRI